jgi:hypothetical protein
MTIPTADAGISYTTEHLDLEGAMIDRENGYPEIKLELQPIGILTEHPYHRLQISINGKKTVLDNYTACLLRDWLNEKMISQKEE